jgi:undecaprenyl-diphosphatase
MSSLEIILLGIVQGITEFLPISSDGHLAVTNALLQAWGYEKSKDQLEVTLVLHLGTLAAVFVFYRREIWRVLTSQQRAIAPIILGTIPAVIIGLTIEKGLPTAWHDWLLESPLLAGLGFLATAAVLWWGGHAAAGDQQYPDVRSRQALAIGLLQATAILPGVSRSGTTIAGGLATGLRREDAAAFSFLLAIPAIGGAGLLKAIDVVQVGYTSTPLAMLALGFAVSMIVGLAALAMLLRFVKGGRLSMFIYYLVPLGVAVTAWQLLK